SLKMDMVEERETPTTGHADAQSPNTSRILGDEAVLCRVKVLYDFEAQPDSQELKVKTGEVLEVLEMQDDG
ncbi:hypothetical protein HK097_003233, partial [Rhizophlyctis rosea]